MFPKLFMVAFVIWNTFRVLWHTSVTRKASPMSDALLSYIVTYWFMWNIWQRYQYEKASEDQAKHVSNILSADQSSNGNVKEEIKNEFPMNDKVEEKRVEKNFSIFEYVKFSDCEVNVFVNGLK